MKKAKKLTKPGLEKIVREMTEVFKKHHVYSNIDIVYIDKMICVGSTIYTRESNYEQMSEPKVTIKQGRRPSDYNGNDNTLIVMYDGGPLYSAMKGEYGWDWRKRIMDDLVLILGPYHLGIEEVDHISFTLEEDVIPDYERVCEKLRIN